MNLNLIPATVLVSIAKEEFDVWRNCQPGDYFADYSFTQPYTKVMDALADGNEDLALHFLKEISYDANLFIHNHWVRTRITALIDGVKALLLLPPPSSSGKPMNHKHKVTYHYKTVDVGCGCCFENGSYLTVNYVNAETGAVTGSMDFDVNVMLENAEEGVEYMNKYFSVGAHLYEFDADNSEFY